jgi:sugar lactone lactonase YvrE
LWLAQWGAARIAAYDSKGRFQTAIELSADQITCPAFGGEDLTSLYVTSATEGIDAKAFIEKPDQGRTFEIAGVVKGLPEPRVIL